LGADQWRQRVVLVPQFHDNRLFMGSFAFNLLMGREWPPSSKALQEAEEVCEALGLGELLDRMPGRLSQPVGETGWRLSHGEQTRVFIARAVLQRPEVMILDESLAALDTANLTRVLGFLREQPSALVAIAHP
jgi:ATP-binding cassette subfamily B protein